LTAASSSGGFQFAHLESYSRKGDKHGRSVSFVLAEARRDLCASLHVERPRAPAVIDGIGIEEVEQLHDGQAADAMTIPKGGKPRHIRQDQHTLMTVVVSHPATPDEVRSDPRKLADVLEWERRNLAWLKGMFGNGLVSVVRHEDESRWHLHAFVLPTSQDMRASALHPGLQAKALVMTSGPTEKEDSKALNRRGDAAYKAAMRGWQDDYFRTVAAPCGLARLGPRGRRLRRAEWHAEKVQAKALQAAIQRADRVQRSGDAYIEKVRAAAAAAEGKIAAGKASIEHARRLQEKADLSIAEAVNATQAAESVLRAAGRTKGFGGLLRAFFDGLRFSNVREAVRTEFSARLDQAQTLVDAMRTEVLAERTRRREAEAKASASSASVRDLARQRDEAWRELNALRPTLVQANQELKFNRR